MTKALLLTKLFLIDLQCSIVGYYELSEQPTPDQGAALSSPTSKQLAPLVLDIHVDHLEASDLAFGPSIPPQLVEVSQRAEESGLRNLDFVVKVCS